MISDMWLCQHCVQPLTGSSGYETLDPVWDLSSAFCHVCESLESPMTQPGPLEWFLSIGGEITLSDLLVDVVKIGMIFCCLV